MIHGGPQDADQRLDPCMGIHIGQVRLHDVTGGESESGSKSNENNSRSRLHLLSISFSVLFQTTIVLSSKIV